MFSHFAIRVVLGGVASLVGALVAQFFVIPLPWLLGPLFCVAALRLLNAPIATIRPLRNIGQCVIGVSLGLYFSPEIGQLITDHWVPLIIGMLIALLLGVFGTWLLSTVGRVDVKTAWFSSAIGGASEMSILAERYGARVDLVASAHSLRVLAVVTIVPLGFEVLGIKGSDLGVFSTLPLNFTDLVLISCLAVLFGKLFSCWRIPSAWVLGPLIATASLTFFELTATSIPSWVINSGQLFLGWALGDRYRPAFFKAAPRFMSAVGFFSVMSIVFVALIGLATSKVTNIPLPTIWLGIAPGGLAEMAITAKVLMLGVPMVTTFQVTRMAFVVITTGLIYERVIEPRITVERS